MGKDTITIDGLSRFAKGLKQMDADLPKTLRVAFNGVANIVIDDARPRIPTRTGRAARSLKAKSTRTAVRISAGGRQAPYFPWLDFGGAGPNNRPARRPFYTDGRYVWKSFADKRSDVQAALEKALAGAAQSAGLEVS